MNIIIGEITTIIHLLQIVFRDRLLCSGVKINGSCLNSTISSSTCMKCKNTGHNVCHCYSSYSGSDIPYGAITLCESQAQWWRFIIQIVIWFMKSLDEKWSFTIHTLISITEFCLPVHVSIYSELTIYIRLRQRILRQNMWFIIVANFHKRNAYSIFFESIYHTKG